jgi:hypothetical protein
VKSLFFIPYANPVQLGALRPLLVPLLVPPPVEEPVDDEDEPELPLGPLSPKPSPPLVLLHPGDAARPTKDEARPAMIVCRRMRAPLLAT